MPKWLDICVGYESVGSFVEGDTRWRCISVQRKRGQCTWFLSPPFAERGGIFRGRNKMGDSGKEKANSAEDERPDSKGM
ncbi:hypothetical protein PIB30_012657 [Stylosanthes scabra]|uniref:Uncharacterized protein n=1 Tax=Stylosanthes scabra TaxID=79078 RepID=A0ABU6Z6K0_9FABA|nr:hypothetical protein [Stylosanthes scabra]